MRATVRFTMNRMAPATSHHTNRSASTSEDQRVDERGSTRSVHVFVVDENGDPVTGQDVTAHCSSARGPNTVRHQYTDVAGHAEFLGEHTANPLDVAIVVRGQSYGPYAVEDGARYTVTISRA